MAMMMIRKMAAAAVIALTVLSCSTGKVSESHDESIRPDQHVVSSSSTAAETLKVLPQNTQTPASDSLRPVMLAMLEEQNKRLDAIVQQLRSLTQQNASSISAHSMEETVATHDRSTNQALIEMIRDQNQRLNDVVEQLKTLAQNQQPAGTPNQAAAAESRNPVPAEKKSAHAVRNTNVSQWADISLRYGKAIRFYQSGKYAKAVRSFSSLLKHGVPETLADNCYFWMGVSYCSMHRLHEAISTLTKVFSCPHSDKLESTYFMLGQCYEQAGTPSMARAMFQKMLQEYPQSTLKSLTEKKIALLN